MHVRMQAGEHDVRGHLEARIHAMVRITRWDLERVVDGRQREDALRRRLFGEDDPQAGAVGPRVAVRGVVHLEHDVRTGLDELSLPGFQNLRRLARSVADQKITGQRAGFGLFIRTDLWAGLWGGEEDTGRLAPEPLRFRFADERDEVMHDVPLGGTYFRRLNPAVLGEVRRHDDVLIVDDARGRNLEGHRQLEHQVRCPDAPSLDPCDGLRQIAPIALGRSAVGPSHDGVDVRGAQTHGVREPAVVRIGEPGRHPSIADGVLDLGRTPTRALIGQQRERARFTGPMADLAILLEDRRDVLRVGRDAGLRRGPTANLRLVYGHCRHGSRGHRRGDHPCAQRETASHRSPLAI